MPIALKPLKEINLLKKTTTLLNHRTSKLYL